jgi:hypothetical protein
MVLLIITNVLIVVKGVFKNIAFEKAIPKPPLIIRVSFFDAIIPLGFLKKLRF